MSIVDQHRKDIAKLASPLADSIRGIFAAQKKVATSKRAVTLDNTAETAKTKAAVLPHLTAAVGVGAQRVATATGRSTPKPNDDLAGAWAYKFADQLTTTTQGQLSTLGTDPSTAAVQGVFDARSGLAAAMAATIVSNAINAGGQDYAETLPATQQPTKTWVVTDDNPCVECSEADGETVPATDTFSNGAPHGPIHSGCGCTIDWSAPTSSRAQRTLMADDYTPELEQRYVTTETVDGFVEWRAKYKQADRDAMAKSGEAMADGSYPIKDAEDLSRAIKAVGQGNASHDAIRKHVIARAKALGLTKTIPDNWNADGSLKTTSNAGSPMLEYRRRKAEALRGHLERRSFSIDQMELREQAGSDTLKFRGYASLTETPYEVGPFTETIKRGAFKRTLNSNPDVQLLINHGDGGSGMPIARTGANMTLTEDNRGLLVDADLDPEDADVQLLARKMKNKLIDQMSFSFRADDQEWSDDFTKRDIKALTIHRGDVSIVNQGASPTTSAAIRSDEVLQSIRHFGYDAFREAVVDLAGYITGGEPEQRDTSKLDPHTVEVLSAVLRAFQAIDDNADEGIPMLADLLGVPNPNKESAHNPDGSPKKSTSTSGSTDAPHTSTATDGSSRSIRHRREYEAAAMLLPPTTRAPTPVAVLNDPIGKQTCPICKGTGKVNSPAADGKKNCSNCSGKGWTRKAAS